jgi:hypothetical protein
MRKKCIIIHYEKRGDILLFFSTVYYMIMDKTLPFWQNSCEKVGRKGW